ncbi:MAG TPA: OsmC family protein [Gaiellaceae bacterium]|nr:OsmC family protein [Gaiellaceae bacterium]
MARFKEFRFPVAVRWGGGKRVVASVAGKPELEVATPPEFKGGFEGLWSPEDALVAAAATCFGVTLVAVCDRAEVPLRDFTIDGVGLMGGREDDTFGFTAIELTAAIETEPGYEVAMNEAAERAEAGCFVSQALSVPVRLELDVRARVAA